MNIKALFLLTNEKGSEHLHCQTGMIQTLLQALCASLTEVQTMSEEAGFLQQAGVWTPFQMVV